jgi:hypothetical protein
VYGNSAIHPSVAMRQCCVLYFGKFGQGRDGVAPSYVTHRFSMNVFAPAGDASPAGRPYRSTGRLMTPRTSPIALVSGERTKE